MSIMLGVVYDELDVDSYEGISIKGDGVDAIYFEGSIEEDLKSAIRKAVAENKDGLIMFSSSLDNFVFDTNGAYEWYEDLEYGEMIRKVNSDKESQND